MLSGFDKLSITRFLHTLDSLSSSSECNHLFLFLEPTLLDVTFIIVITVLVNYIDTFTVLYLVVHIYCMISTNYVVIHVFAFVYLVLCIYELGISRNR